MLATAHLVACNQHRHPLRKQQGSKKIAFLAGTQGINFRIVSFSLDTTIPGMISVVTIAVVFLIGFVVLVVVSHQVMQGKPIVRTDEIDAAMITEVWSTLIPLFPDIEFGLHLHTTDHGWYSKVNAAYLSGCRRFDCVINGWGGCPMAGKEMLGNLKTENLISFAEEKKTIVKIDQQTLREAYKVAGKIFF